MLLGNEEIREFNQYLFNDSLLALHMMFALYFILVRNSPQTASFFLTLSISIKAGAVLMIPTFLGWIMYLHGFALLLKCLTIILAFQFMVMAPLCFDPFAKFFGFPAGMTHYWDYLKYAKFIEDKERKYGATQDMSIFWHQVSSEIYYSKGFVPRLKKIMMFINFWFFFVRRFCAPRCIMNVLSVTDSKWSRQQKLRWRDQILATELMVVCYIAGAQFVPGGHQ